MTTGVRRIHAALRTEQHRVSRRLVARLMRQLGLAATPRRRFVATTQADPQAPAAPNHLARAFAVGRPNERWVADLTYGATPEGWLYVAVVLDVGSRRVIGWAASVRLATPLVQAALDQALSRRPPAVGLVHHSDRGRQRGFNRSSQQSCGSPIVASR